MHTHEGYVTTSDGVKLFYQVLGSGPRTVVVPNGTYLAEDLAPLARGRRLVFFDLRNRGRSDACDFPPDGILRDVDDVHAVAQHVAGAPVDLVGHSFAALLCVLYARQHSNGRGRIVQIAPISADADRRYPAPLMNRDTTFHTVMNALTSLGRERPNHDPQEYCEKVWAVLRRLYVTDPANAHRIRWGRCALPNERNAMQYFQEHVLPSIRRLAIGAQLREVTSPVLVVHGTKDRSAPYGAGRDWASMLPNARLLTITEGGHAPWIEAPDDVLGAIETFLRGDWPSSAQSVRELLPL